MLRGKHGGGMTDIARRVIELLASPPIPWCDDCIARELELPRRQQAQAVTAVLEETHLYDRYRGTCHGCDDASKMVISRKVSARAQKRPQRTEAPADAIGRAVSIGFGR